MFSAASKPLHSVRKHIYQKIDDSTKKCMSPLGRLPDDLNSTFTYIYSQHDTKPCWSILAHETCVQPTKPLPPPPSLPPSLPSFPSFRLLFVLLPCDNLLLRVICRSTASPAQVPLYLSQQHGLNPSAEETQTL